MDGEGITSRGTAALGVCALLGVLALASHSATAGNAPSSPLGPPGEPDVSGLRSQAATTLESTGGASPVMQLADPPRRSTGRRAGRLARSDTKRTETKLAQPGPTRDPSTTTPAQQPVPPEQPPDGDVTIEVPDAGSGRRAAGGRPARARVTVGGKLPSTGLAVVLPAAFGALLVGLGAAIYKAARA
jgi:hypothetical protein